MLLVVVVLLFAFTPIARVLLRTVDGSFSPSRYSSLALKTPGDAAIGVHVGTAIPVTITNHMGRTETYHWRATQGSSLISLGEETVNNGSASTIVVPSRGAVSGTLRITLLGTNIFLTVPTLKK
jgi:hypothetical protein